MQHLIKPINFVKHIIGRLTQGREKFELNRGLEATVNVDGEAIFSLSDSVIDDGDLVEMYNGISGKPIVVRLL
jgi:hypothetical protein